MAHLSNLRARLSVLSALTAIAAVQVLAGDGFAQRAAPKREAAKPSVEKPDVVERPYGEGPLTFDDFQAETPADYTSGAHLVADVRYQYTYRLERRGAELVAHLTGIELFAMARRHRSWIVDRQNAEALAYPQGHFDIGQLHALKCQQLLWERGFAGETFAGTGQGEQEAVGAMEQNFQKAFQPILEQSEEAHRRYDAAIAAAGEAKAETIAAQRKVVLEELAKLTAELKKLGAKRRPKR